VAPSLPTGSALTAALQQVGNDVYGLAGRPATTVAHSLGSYLGALVGGL
jgi:hypothetical protein